LTLATAPPFQTGSDEMQRKSLEIHASWSKPAKQAKGPAIWGFVAGGEPQFASCFPVIKRKAQGLAVPGPPFGQ
jgi:hypothetical protein